VKKLKLWTGLLALFLSGCFIGAMGAWMAGEYHIMNVLHHDRGDIPRIIIDKLTRELDLNESQKARITEIVCRTHAELMDLHRRTQPEREQILERSTLQMKAELSPEQQKKLDALHQEMEERRAKRKPGSKDESGNPCESSPQEFKN
jgi:Spy/CpxP family protein refolding chaperone